MKTRSSLPIIRDAPPVVGTAYFPDYMIKEALALRDTGKTLQDIAATLKSDHPGVTIPSFVTISRWIHLFRSDGDVASRELALLQHVDELVAQYLTDMPIEHLIKVQANLRSANIRREYIRLQIAVTAIRSKADLEHNTEIRELVEELERANRIIVDAKSSTLP